MSRIARAVFAHSLRECTKTSTCGCTGVFWAWIGLFWAWMTYFGSEGVISEGHAADRARRLRAILPRAEEDEQLGIRCGGSFAVGCILGVDDLFREWTNYSGVGIFLGDFFCSIFAPGWFRPARGSSGRRSRSCTELGCILGVDAFWEWMEYLGSGKSIFRADGLFRECA